MTNLKKLRQDRGLTQAEIAKLADLNLRTYQDYEQGAKPINRIALEDGLKAGRSFEGGCKENNVVIYIHGVVVEKVDTNKLIGVITESWRYGDKKLSQQGRGINRCEDKGNRHVGCESLPTSLNNGMRKSA